MRATSRAAAVGAVLVVLASATQATAQLKLGGMNVEGEVETGLRFLPGGEPSESRRAKFEEYRDITEGPFLAGLRLRFFRPDESYSAEFGGAKWGQEDQEYFLTAGRTGLWQFGFEWDQIPHVYSTTARFLAQETSRGVFVLPTPRPALNLHNAVRREEISQRWDTAKISLTFTPIPDLDLIATYTRIHKDGEKPYSMAFGGPGGNFYEILEPIEHTIHDLRLSGTYARETWQVTFGYALSIFNNDLRGVQVDNPCFGLTAAVTAASPGCGAADGATTGASAVARTGQVSLAPSNMANTWTVGGAVNLPLRTRITGNASYSLRLQDESFVPHTSNPAISSPLLALPQSSLDGMVGTFLLNVNATSRPIRPLTLSLKYRFFDYNDMTDELELPAHVVNDRGPIVAEDRLATRFSYTKHNADLDAKWRFGAPLALTVGGAWERWDRIFHREVPTSDEYFGKVAVDVTPVDWMSARATYRPSFRRIDEYNTSAHLAHTVVEELTASEIRQSQSLLLRKFDEADRDRQRIDLMVQFFPTDVFTTTLSGSYRDDDYLRSSLGLQEGRTWSAGVDFTYAPLPNLSFYGGYVYESIREQQRSRSRPVTGSTTFDFPDYDWTSENLDQVHTFHAGATVGVIPKVLDWTIGASYAHARGEVNNANPLTPTSGTAAQRATAAVKKFPAFEDTLLRLDTGLRYHFWKTWSAAIGYAFEKFDNTDWRSDNLNPFVPGISAIWLGNDTKGYAAHILTATIRYRFK